MVCLVLHCETRESSCEGATAWTQVKSPYRGISTPHSQLLHQPCFQGSLETGHYVLGPKYLEGSNRAPPGGTDRSYAERWAKGSRHETHVQNRTKPNQSADCNVYAERTCDQAIVTRARGLCVPHGRRGSWRVISRRSSEGKLKSIIIQKKLCTF